MPNDRNSSSILSNQKLANYSTLAKFLSNSAQSSKKPSPSSVKTGNIKNSSKNDKKDLEKESLEVLESLLSQNIAVESQKKLENPRAQAEANSANRAKEALDSTDAKIEKKVETGVEALLENQIETKVEKPAEQAAEVLKAEELSKEIKEVSKESREQKEAVEIKEKQASIDDLVKQAANAPIPTDTVTENKPVVILPITETAKATAKFKTTKDSLKWLSEFAEKIAKIFSGAFVYKEELDQSEDV